jgi:hypothetical protein
MSLPVIPQWLAIWACVGFIATIILPCPKSKLGAWIFLFALGPLVWLLFIPVSIDVVRKKKKETGE